MKNRHFSFLILIVLCIGTADFAQAADVTLYTPKGHSVYAFTRSEMSSSEITYSNGEYQRQYPNATFLANSSYTYNCHSYAWNMVEGGRTC